LSLVVLGLRASTCLSALSCVSAVVMHIVAVCLRMNKVDYDDEEEEEDDDDEYLLIV